MKRGTGKIGRRRVQSGDKPPLIQMYKEGNGKTPLTFKYIGGCRRTNGEQVHIEIHERRPRAGKVMAETMAPALQPDD